jgi:diadenosine tetraphosphate (Ap4A) HIT family hydrolase
MNDFELHPRLNADCFAAGDWPLCRLLMMNDSQYPWFILVPRRDGLREIHELSDADQLQFLRESVMLGRALMKAFKGEKLNVAALGNMVPQLHVHHIVRYSSDAAWPGPVWGKLPAQPYTQDAALKRLDELLPQLPLALQPVA